AESRGAALRARRRPFARGGNPLRQTLRGREGVENRAGLSRRPAERPPDVEGRGRRGRDRENREQVDRDSGRTPAGGRNRKADPHGGAIASSRGRTRSGPRERGQRDSPKPFGAERPESSYRLVPVPRADGRRQDGTCPYARRIPVRR